MLRRRDFTFMAAGSLVAAATATPVRAQSKPVLRVASLTLPVFSPIVINILKANNFDAKHGFTLEAQTYPSLAAFYVGLATGEVDTLLGGPTNFQKLRAEGVAVKIVATGATLADLAIMVSDPAIKTFSDLRGKQLAVDMGAAQFLVLSIYAKSTGIELGKDIKLIGANFSVARAQLTAGRVDAALVIEPIATLMLRADPKFRIVLNGNDAWKELTGHDGWELVYGVREDAIKRAPDLPNRFIAALQDTAAFFRSNIDDADKIVVETVKLPKGVFKQAVESKRWEFVVRPAWEGERKVIWDMFERAVAAGFHAKMPDEAIIYVP
jgi:ABC-type nitrate/sulfonate/bicarbonate transport system substrate-binding protein